MPPKAAEAGTCPQPCQHQRRWAFTVSRPSRAHPFPGFLSTSQEVTAFTSFFLTAVELFGAGSGRMSHVVVHVIPSGTPPQHNHFWMQFYLQMGLQGGDTAASLVLSLPPPALGAGRAPGGKHGAFPKALHHTVSFRQQEMRNVGPSWHMQLQTRAPERWKVAQLSHTFGLVWFLFPFH